MIKTVEEILEEISFAKEAQEELRVEIEPILGKIQRLTSTIGRLREDLKKVCNHPEDRYLVNKDYQEGGYDYQATSTITVNCGVCGKLLDEKVTFHGFQ